MGGGYLPSVLEPDLNNSHVQASLGGQLLANMATGFRSSTESVLKSIELFSFDSSARAATFGARSARVASTGVVVVVAVAVGAVVATVASAGAELVALGNVLRRLACGDGGDAGRTVQTFAFVAVGAIKNGVNVNVNASRALLAGAGVSCVGRGVLMRLGRASFAGVRLRALAVHRLCKHNAQTIRSSREFIGEYNCNVRKGGTKLGCKADRSRKREFLKEEITSLSRLNAQILPSELRVSTHWLAASSAFQLLNESLFDYKLARDPASATCTFSLSQSEKAQIRKPINPPRNYG